MPLIGAQPQEALASGARSREDRGSSTSHKAGRESRAQRWLPVPLMLMGVYERRVRAGDRALQRDCRPADPPPAFTSARLVTGSMSG